MVRGGKGKDKDKETESTRWNDENTQIFLDICNARVKAMLDRKIPEKMDWKGMANEFFVKTKYDYTKDVLKHKYDNLKTKWTLWNRLRGKETGLGWDGLTQTIDASDEWWAAREKENSDYKPLRKNGLKFAKDLDTLFQVTIATGSNRWTPSMIPSVFDKPIDDGLDSIFGNHTYTPEPVTPTQNVPLGNEEPIIESPREFVTPTNNPTMPNLSGKRQQASTSNQPRKKKKNEDALDNFMETMTTWVNLKLENRIPHSLPVSDPIDDQTSKLMTILDSLALEDSVYLFACRYFQKIEARAILFKMRESLRSSFVINEYQRDIARGSI